MLLLSQSARNTAGKTKRRHRSIFRIVSIALGLSLCTTFFQVPPNEAQATSGFNASNIISDDIFYNGRDLNQAQIQDFLNQKVPQCTLGSPGRPAGGYANINGSNTLLSEFCLKNSRFDTTSRPANQYCSAYPGGMGESAAAIIQKVAVACNINPKVLLVMLDKEQSLVTDSWPAQHQMDRAMGYGCPDSGPNFSANCDTKYYGLYNQIYLSAWQLQVYKAHPNNYRYKPFQTNTIQWHPSPACGTSQVFIENYATAALYIYTPYRPNQAALNAGWGIGDTCSAYGNRNFFNYFTSWFGLTGAPGNTNSPQGNIDSVTGVEGGVQVRGWAFDPDTTQSVTVTVTIGNETHSLNANSRRDDVKKVYPSQSANHGFDGYIETELRGTQNVCITARNIGAGSDIALGCKTANVQELTKPKDKNRAPVGSLDGVSVQNNTVTVAGWALDPDTLAPAEVHVYAGSTGVATKATQERKDIAAHYPLYGANRGYSATIPNVSGTVNVCAYAIDHSGKAGNTTLGCKQVTVNSGGNPQDQNRAPVGSLDGVSVQNNTVTVAGWALDPDTLAPAEVHVYAGSTGVATKATQERKDIAAHYPLYGANRGYSATIPNVSGTVNVCAYAIDHSGKAGNTTLGCKEVRIGG